MSKPSFVFVRCMDYRLSSAAMNLRESLEIMEGDYDLVSIPGGAGHLKSLREALGIAVTHHGVSNVILTVHEDCAAGKTVADLLLGYHLAREIAPGTTIRLFNLKLDGGFEEIQIPT